MQANDNNFMRWVTQLPEVGTPILRERERLLTLAKEAAALDQKAATLRATLRGEQNALLSKLVKIYSLAEIEATERRVSIGCAPSSLREVMDHKMRDALRDMDGFHTAIQALSAFKEGEVLRQADLLSTATDQGTANTLRRVLDWWNVAARPVLERVKMQGERNAAN